MITTIEDYKFGAVKMLGQSSISAQEIDTTEREIFPQVFSGISIDEISTADYPLFKKSFKYFVWFGMVEGRSQFMSSGGAVTKTARDYGNSTALNLLNKWAAGVDQLYVDFDAIKALYPDIEFVAQYKL